MSRTKPLKKRSWRQEPPQGSVLGPLLFIIYMNALDRQNKIAYADDVTLWDGSEDPRGLQGRLQANLNNTTTFLRNNKILVNAGKTQAIIITRKKKNNRPPSNLKAEGVEIP